MFFSKSLEQKREQALKAAKNPVMQKFLGTPIPDKKEDWRDLEIVSLDLETTGLNSQQDQIISYGLVVIDKGRIRLSSSKYEILSITGPVSASSAVIHEITDDQSKHGMPLPEALETILQQLSGRVMLVHYRDIEQSFINQACEQLYGSPFIIPTIDTMQLGDQLMRLQNHQLLSTSLRLYNLREQYGLPNYKAHNALSDAISTAELFMAQATEIKPQGKACLKQFLC